MGVTTTADEKISEAREKLAGAYKALLVVLDEDTWGHGEFKDGYMDTIHEVAISILKLKQKL